MGRVMLPPMPHNGRCRAGQHLHPRRRMLISDPTVDAVDICLPTPLHHRFARPPWSRASACLLRDADGACDLVELAMRDAARKAGVCCRSDCWCARSRATATSRRSRTPARLGGCSACGPGDWVPTSQAGRAGSQVALQRSTTELMTFDLDFAGWLMGAPQRLVSAAGAGRSRPLGYGDGRSATIVASGLMPVGTRHTRASAPCSRAPASGCSRSFGTARPEEHQLPPCRRTNRGCSRPTCAAWQPCEIELRSLRRLHRRHGRADLLDAERAIERCACRWRLNGRLPRARPSRSEISRRAQLSRRRVTSRAGASRAASAGTQFRLLRSAMRSAISSSVEPPDEPQPAPPALQVAAGDCDALVDFRRALQCRLWRRTLGDRFHFLARRRGFLYRGFFAAARPCASSTPFWPQYEGLRVSKPFSRRRWAADFDRAIFPQGRKPKSITAKPA